MIYNVRSQFLFDHNFRKHATDAAKLAESGDVAGAKKILGHIIENENMIKGQLGQLRMALDSYEGYVQDAFKSDDATRISEMTAEANITLRTHVLPIIKKIYEEELIQAQK